MSETERRALRAVWMKHLDDYRLAVKDASVRAEANGFPLVAVKLRAAQFALADANDAYSHLAREAYEVEKLKAMFLLVGQPGMEGAREHAVPVFAALTHLSGVLSKIDVEMHEALDRIHEMEEIFA